jgi:hypothetical protein
MLVEILLGIAIIAFLFMSRDKEKAEMNKKGFEYRRYRPF